MDAPGLGQDPFTYSNDELAVLAESFFQQRNGNIGGECGRVVEYGESLMRNCSR